jgi:probable HAF family extracellular repeat protein
MKSRILTCITAMMLFAALAIPVRLAAQDHQDNKHHKHVRYTVTDLGTLGGGFSEGVGINNRGSVSGNSTLPGDTVKHGFFWRKGVMTDLGTLGGPNSFAPEEWSPNNRDEVAGFSDTSTLDPNGENLCGFLGFYTSPYICRPFVWRRGVMTELPTLGGNNGAAIAINDRGQLTGIAETTIKDPTCVLPQLFDFKAVIWEPNKGKVRACPTARR